MFATLIACAGSGDDTGGAGVGAIPLGGSGGGAGLGPTSGQGGAAVPPISSGGAGMESAAGTGVAGGNLGAGTGGIVAPPPAGAGGTGGSIAGTGGAGSSGGGVTCTGKPGGSGNETRMHNNVQYIVHFPSGIDANTGVPLLFVAHGFTMSGALMQSITGFDAVADREKFVVVYPNGDGGGTPWNVGEGACAPGSLVNAPAADSLGYLDAMRASVEETQCIIPDQVFVTGFSMGGYFANHVGCQKGNTFARAVGPHSGGTYPGDCPGAPVPIFIMHGSADTFIDHVACGQGARDFWLERNMCGTQTEARPVMGGSCTWYMGCDPNGQTVYCEFDGIGHAWAAGATEAVWDFFKMYL